MKSIFHNQTHPRWFVFGDFNCVRSQEERMGSNFCHTSAFHFNKFIFDTGLTDIKLGGRKFTYMSADGSKHSKLDRFLITHNSLSDWPQLSLIALPRIHSGRLKLVINIVISPIQTAFIKNRSILDGPLIVNEVISWLKKSKQKAFIFKVEFEKVFDSLNWGYLDSIMSQMAFGHKWCLWIKGCLSSAKASVLFNGSPTVEFSMEKGVRQGDPLSPFLFIITVEGLNIAMEEAFNKNIFRGIKLPNNDPTISHLQYADNVIFLGSWSIDNARNLIIILRCFEFSSGLKVNILRNFCPNTKIESFARNCCCSMGQLLFTYLGLAVGASMSRAVHWNPIIDKFRSKLNYQDGKQ